MRERRAAPCGHRTPEFGSCVQVPAVEFCGEKTRNLRPGGTSNPLVVVVLPAGTRKTTLRDGNFGDLFARFRRRLLTMASAAVTTAPEVVNAPAPSTPAVLTSAAIAKA